MDDQPQRLTPSPKDEGIVRKILAENGLSDADPWQNMTDEQFNFLFSLKKVDFSVRDAAKIMIKSRRATNVKRMDETLVSDSDRSDSDGKMHPRARSLPVRRPAPAPAPAVMGARGAGAPIPNPIQERTVNSGLVGSNPFATNEFKVFAKQTIENYVNTEAAKLNAGDRLEFVDFHEGCLRKILFDWKRKGCVLSAVASQLNDDVMRLVFEFLNPEDEPAKPKTLLPAAVLRMLQEGYTSLMEKVGVLREQDRRMQKTWIRNQEEHVMKMLLQYQQRQMQPQSSIRSERNYIFWRPEDGFVDREEAELRNEWRMKSNHLLFADAVSALTEKLRESGYFVESHTGGWLDGAYSPQTFKISW